LGRRYWWGKAFNGAGRRLQQPYGRWWPCRKNHRAEAAFRPLSATFDHPISARDITKRYDAFRGPLRMDAAATPGEGPEESGRWKSQNPASQESH